MYCTIFYLNVKYINLFYFRALHNLSKAVDVKREKLYNKIKNYLSNNLNVAEI